MKHPMKPNGKHEFAIRQALGACAACVEETRPRGWRVSLANGRPLDVDVQADENWLTLSTPVPGARADCIELLRLNHGLGGSSRIALVPGTWSLELRSDVPLVDTWPDSDLPEAMSLAIRIGEACDGLKQASDRLHGGLHTRDDEPDPAERVWSDCAAVTRLADLCREAGWPYVERRGGALAIELDVADACHHALFELRSERAELSVPVTLVDVESAHAREAIGVLLLSACRTLRFARAAVTGGQAPTARFEVMFAEPPVAPELDEALRALSTACLLCAREAEMLREQAVAMKFLDVVKPERGARLQAGVDARGRMVRHDAEERWNRAAGQ
jgi:hypothetical protein